MARQIITFHYDLKNESGEMIESSRQGKPLAFLEGSGAIIPGLETALVGLSQGQTKEVFVPYMEAYGAYDQALVAEVPRGQFPTPTIQEGDMFQIQKTDGVRVVMVIAVNEDKVTIDANHPLAGRDLTFNVEIIGRRDATPEEISHGHVHGEGGHHH